MAVVLLSVPKPPNSMSPFCFPHLLLLLTLSLLCSYLLSPFSPSSPPLSPSLRFSLSLSPPPTASYPACSVSLSLLSCPFLPPPLPSSLSVLFNFFCSYWWGAGALTAANITGVCVVPKGQDGGVVGGWSLAPSRDGGHGGGGGPDTWGNWQFPSSAESGGGA